MIPDGTYLSNLYGISLSLTENALVKQNIITRMGRGIYINGDALGSQFSCNDFDKNWFGFYFNSSILSDQLINPSQFGNNTTSDNYWYDIPTVSATTALRRLAGSVSSTGTVWNHQLLNNNIYNIYSPYLIRTNPLQYYITSVQNQPYNIDCNVQFPAILSEFLSSNTDTTFIAVNTNATTRDQLLDKIVKNIANYQISEQISKYFAKTFAYKLLDETPAYLALGTTNDSIYQNFQSSVHNTTIGKLHQVGKYINTQNYTAARNLNMTLTGQNTIENNLITVNNIYLNKVVNNQYFGTADSLMLVDIAYQSPLSGGSAVFAAQAMLGIYLMEDETDYAVAPGHQALSVEKTELKVYPNPANDKLFIELNETMEGNANIDIYDLNARLCFSTNINTAQKLQTIDISSVKKGIYNIRITTKNQSENQKLVIIK